MGWGFYTYMAAKIQDLREQEFIQRVSEPQNILSLPSCSCTQEFSVEDKLKGFLLVVLHCS